MPESTPDPSGYSRHISYTLPEQTKTLLQVRTIDGALVEVLVEGIFPQRNYSCEWDASAVPDWSITLY